MFNVTLIPAYEDNYFFFVKCQKGNFVIDPGKFEPVDDYLTQNNFKLDFILNTHHHWDHVSGNQELKDKYNCKIIGHKKDSARIPGIDIEIEADQTIEILGKQVNVFNFDGHTIGHIGYYFEEHSTLFCGDTLFAMGCGRLFEGTAQQLLNSLNKIKKLPLDTVIYCAHEYTLNNAKFALTVDKENPELFARKKQVEVLRANNKHTIPTNLELELATNPFLRCNEKSIQEELEVTNELDAFTKMRKLKDSF